jgi:hypothetical protein
VRDSQPLFVHLTEQSGWVPRRYVLALLGVYPRSPKALKRLGKEERKRARRETKQLKLITKGKVPTARKFTSASTDFL